MIYFIFGNQDVLINNKLNIIVKDNEHVHYYGNDKDFSISSLISDLNTSSLFSDKTFYILHNYTGLNKKISDEEYNLIEKYILNPSSVNDLIFVSNNVSKSLKLYKLLAKNAETYEFNVDNKNFNNYCGQAFSEFNIKLNRKLKDELINNCNYDYSLLYNNLKNLSVYDGEITEETIKELTSINNEIDVFNLINSILTRNSTQSIKFYRQLVNNYDVRQLISILVGQLHYMYVVLYYEKNKKTVDEICELTNTSNPYRVNMTLNKARNFSLDRIIELLSSLYDFNYKIRFNNKLDINDFFEVWLLNL